MKYKNLKTSSQKILHIPVPINGMDMSSSNNNSNLYYCSNVEFKNGRLETRKGLKSFVDNVLDISGLKGALAYEYKITDTVFYIDEIPLNIAYVNVTLDSNTRCCRSFLIGEEGFVMVLGDIDFSRVDASTFFVPNSISFYTGKPQNGGGIFAIVAMNNLYDSEQQKFAVYEINKDLEKWIEVKDFYIPTVYINGRGNRYEFAEQTGEAYEKAPMSLEKLNILNGKFYAYYSSDGYSSSFKLPFVNITDSKISCRIYTAADAYTEWQIDSGKTKDTKTFFSTSVTMHLSRSKGVFYFTVEAGDFAVPLMSQYKANNIRIFAQSKTDEDFYSIASAKHSAVIADDIYFAGGEKKNKIYYTSFSNPLYFPQIYDNEIGSADTEVTALVGEKDKLIAFKPFSVYAINVKQGNSINDNALLNDNGKIFSATNSVSVSCVTNQYGNSYKDTAAFVGSRCIWFDGERIRAMSLNGYEIYDIDKQVLPLLEVLSESDIKTAFGFADQDKYHLLLGNKAVVIKVEDNKYKFYVWQLPSGFSLLGAAKSYALTVFLCYNEKDKICYIAYPFGDKDIVIKKQNGEFIEAICDIQSFIKLSGLRFGGMSNKKRLKGLSLQIDSQSDVKVKLLSKTRDEEYTILNSSISDTNDNIVNITTDIYGVGVLGIELDAVKSISLGDCDIYYIDY